MAAIAHGFVSAAARTTNSTTSFVTVATINDAAFKVDNAKYLLIVIAKIDTDDNANPIGEWRMARGAIPTQLDRSFRQMEPAASSDGFSHQYNWFTVFTQPATAEDVFFQQRVNTTPDNVHTDDLTMYWVRLDADLTENTDWQVAVDTSGPTPHTAVMVSRVSLTWTPATAGHDWLILGHGRTTIDTASRKNEFELFDSTASTVEATHKQEGEDTAETQIQSLMTVLAGLPASEQVMQFRTRDTTVGTNDYEECELFCLDLDLFEDHVTDEQGALSQVDNNEIEFNDLAVTPTTAGDWMVLAGIRNITNTSGRRTRHYVTVADTPVPTGFDTNPRYTQSFDASDEQYTMVAHMPNFAASAQDLEIKGEWDNGATQSWDDRDAVAFSMELANGAPPPTVIQDIIMSGGVIPFER